VRHAIAFLRDPAVFTAGQGLSLGDYYRLRVPGYTIHVVTDPDLIEQIMVTDAACYEKSRIYWGELRRIIGEAMGSIEGPGWEYLHQLQQPFFTPRFVQNYLPIAEEITTLRLQHLADHLDGGKEVTIAHVLGELNTQILLSVLFGQHLDPHALEIAGRIADGEAIIAWRSKYPWRPVTGWLTGENQRAARHKRFFREYAGGVAQSNAASDHGILLNALTKITDDSQGPRFPASLLRNEIIVHLGAGTETQGIAEGWILYLLWQNPEVLQRLRDEIERVAGTSVVTMGHVTELIYAKQVVREGLRLYPPSYALVRDCVQSTQLAGRRVKRGHVFFISLHALHRNPRLWEEPNRFDPERFDAERMGSIGKYQYLPFGAGRHVCIGQHLALPCIVLAIAQFAQRFEWTFSDPDIRPVGLSTLKPAGHFSARFKLRR